MYRISPYIRLASYSILDPNEYIRERMIYDYELVYIKEGSVDITIEDQYYRASKGEIYFFRPHQRHSMRLRGTEKLVQPHVHFDLCYRENRSDIPISFKNIDQMTEVEKGLFHEDIVDDLYKGFPQRLVLASSHYFELLLFDLIYAYDNPDTYHEMTLSWLFLRLWTYVLQEVGMQNPNSSRKSHVRVANIKNYIEQNTNRPLNLDELSRVAHYSKYYISKLFKQAYHISPIAYHNMLRIEKAKSLIAYTNISIQMIAEVTGFENQQDFCRAFKKAMGFPPTHYRQNYLLFDNVPGKIDNRLFGIEKTRE